uniref:Uncharacterized protein n=1 Tax=Chelonoidis abingdonii TaxID=106734 RepID=A0A8C0G6M1_CHEAB
TATLAKETEGGSSQKSELFGKENQSATIIQSAWRGCQVRREINGMNKAAAKIQAVFRGYRT